MHITQCCKIDGYSYYVVDRHFFSAGLGYVKVKVKQSRYSPGVAQRVTGS